MASDHDTPGPPGPETMISVLIGASDYPRKPDWTNPVLGWSAQALRDYVLSPAGLALAPGQFLDLFDDEAAPADQLLRIADFLNAAPTARDLLLYYIGHGDFHGDDYLLGVRRTQRGREFVTTIESKKLAKIIREEFRRKRVYVILDSCFSASAVSDWQGDEIAVAVRKMTQPLPTHGTAFLAAASKYDVTSAPRTERCTVFTGAVLAALARGVDRAQPRLSIYELYEEVCDILRRREPRDGDPEGMPEIHVPSQRAGDVSLLPVFPNAAYSRAEASHAVVAYVATETLATSPASTVGGGPAARRWKQWAIGGAIVLLLVLLASTRGTAPPASVPVAPVAAVGNAPFAGRPTEIRVKPPPGMAREQTRNWNKIFEELDKGRFELARRELDEFEDRYGMTDETRDLRIQLDALGPDVQPRARAHRE